MFSAKQCKAARALLGWAQTDLAAAGRALSLVKRFELGGADARSSTVRDLQGALERAGVQFIAKNGGGEGVRLKDGDGK